MNLSFSLAKSRRALRSTPYCSTALQLYHYGLQPFNILLVFERERSRQLAQGAEGGSAAPWSRRYFPSLRDIEKVVEAVLCVARMHPNDVVAVNTLVASLLVGQPGAVLYHHMQVGASSIGCFGCGMLACVAATPVLLAGGGAALLPLTCRQLCSYCFAQETAADGTITQQFRLGLTSPFGLRMLKAFGSELAFMDTTYGLNAYGFVQTTLVVRDDFGNGVPVAACITSAEDDSIYLEFLLAVIQVGPGAGWSLPRAHHLRARSCWPCAPSLLLPCPARPHAAPAALLCWPCPVPAALLRWPCAHAPSAAAPALRSCCARCCAGPAPLPVVCQLKPCAHCRASPRRPLASLNLATS